MYAQAAYMFLAGSGFLLMPNTVLPIFSLAPTGEVWIRVIGLLVVVFGAYYYQMARTETLAFYQASVWGRLAVAAGLAALALGGFGELPLLLFAGVDAGMAVWTYSALRSI